MPSAPDPISWEQPDLRAPCPLSHPMCHCPELFCFCSKTIPESPLIDPSLFPSRVFTYNSPHLCPRPHRIPQHLSLLACPHLPLLEVQSLSLTSDTSSPNLPTPLASVLPLPPTRLWVRTTFCCPHLPSAGIGSSTNSRPLTTCFQQPAFASPFPWNCPKPPRCPLPHNLSTTLWANNANPTSLSNQRSLPWQSFPPCQRETEGLGEARSAQPPAVTSGGRTGMRAQPLPPSQGLPAHPPASSASSCSLCLCHRGYPPAPH